MRDSQWIEINEAALRHNLRFLCGVTKPGTGVVAVVKANAYGHGLEQVAAIACQEADWLGVHSAGEARALRRAGVDCPLLIMGFVGPADLHDLDEDAHVLVSTLEVLEWLGEYRRKTGVALPVHLKVETGTMRQGFALSHIDAACSTAAREGLEIVGVATHFANIEDTLDHQFARQQMRLFHRATSRLRHKLGATPPFVHAACSAATLLFREADYSMVRLGISMYGHWPSRETRLAWVLEHGAAAMELRPVLTWKARVGQLQDVRKGATVGYGRTWTALRRTRLAVIPVGYSDGYSRCLGNRARVLVRGCRAPVVGRVCMNIMMIDVTDVPGVQVGEEVVIIGSQDGATMAVEELASLSDTINYEFLARLSPSIPRLVVDSGQPPEVGASRGSLS